ncbi:hypothetical protein HY745_07680, partial [Candidatus Desantisbacteria bacterium]|nr:hypothetical protein [Candidatus Desantisbacteria bacterium]
NVFKEKNISGGIEPYQFYSAGNILSLSREEAEIDIGIENGIQIGFVYNIHQKGSSIGKIIITSINNEFSRGYIYEKNKNIDEGDRVFFSGMIDIDENISYSRRTYQKITSKITFVDEGGICFIEGNKNSKIKNSMKFDIIKNNEKTSGTLEIIDDSGKGNIIVAQILNSTDKINIGDRVISKKKDSKEWIALALALEKDENSILDAIYAYEMALKLKEEAENYLKNKLLALVVTQAKKYEKKEDFTKSFLLRKKIRGFSKETDEEYDDLKNKIKDIAKEYWNARTYLHCIKYYEVLDSDDQIIKYLSLSYNGLGKEVINKNQELAVYCMKKAIKLMPGNYEAMKKLTAIYENQNEYSKALEILAKMLEITTDEAEKKSISENIVKFKMKEQNIVGNIIFQNLDGRVLSLSSFETQLVLIVLWTRDSTSSDENLDFLNGYMVQKGNTKLKVLLINRENLEPDIIKKYLDEKNITNLMPVIPMSDISTLFENPSIESKPFLNTLLNSKRKIIYQKEEIFGDELETIIKNSQ